MLNYRNLPASRKCLPCNLPRCKCERCSKAADQVKPEETETEILKKFESEEELERRKIKESLNSVDNAMLKEAATAGNVTTSSSDKRSPFQIGKFLKLPRFTMPSFNFPPASFESLMFDIVGVISFFIFGTIMFWVTICQYLWQFVKIVMQSGRKIQLLVLVVFLLVGVSITVHAFICWYRHQPFVIQKGGEWQTNTTDTQPPNYYHHKSCQHKKCYRYRPRKSLKIPKRSSENILTPNLLNHSNSSLTCDLTNNKNHSSLCDLMADNFKDQPTTHTMPSDDETRAMYRRYKLYSIPSEMKSPPSIGHIIEILSGFFSGISGTTTNT